MDMPKTVVLVIFLLVMIGIIVGVDVLFLQNYFWARLLSNIGIVVVFGAIYLRFLKNM
jgi:hypothetical protein